MNKLQWSVATPITVSLKDATGATATGGITCSSNNPTALVIAADCSTATAKRIGSYSFSVSNGSTAATATVQAIAQRHALADANMAGGNSNHAFAALASDASPWLWGSNFFGQLAQLKSYSELNESGLPLRGKLSSTTAMQNISSVALGESSYFAVTEEGEVWSWGRNADNTLGRTALNGDVVPNKVRNAADTGPLTGIVQAASGDSNAAALSDEGYVYAWGWGYTVGRGQNVSAPRPNRVQLPDGTPLGNVVQISAGRNFTLALTANGNVYGWGNNGAGRTGTPHVTGTDYIFYATLAQDGNKQPLADIVSVSAGYSHAMALTRAGQVYAWGSNGSGELGNGQKYQTDQAPSLVLGIDGKTPLGNITSVYASHNFSLALDSAGQVLSWGNATGNQLGAGIGSGVVNERVLPGYVVDIAGTGRLNAVVAIGANFESGYALTADGSVLAWGSNYNNELGQNIALTSLSTPRKVKDASGTGTLSLGSLADFKNPSRRYR